MNCDPLAVTGVELGLPLLLMIAIGCLLAGAGVVLLARRRRRGALTMTTALVVALLVGGSIAVAPVTPAHAAGSDCTSAENTLLVTQTSVMAGIAPGVAARPIAGLVTNQGDDSTHIAEVRVEISAVTPSPDAPAGTCTASDYTIVDPLMPVGITIAPGEVAAFSGAAIGFVNKTTNQDACTGAVIHLLYTANPR